MAEHKFFECRVSSDEIKFEIPDEWKEGFEKRVASLGKLIDRDLDRKRAERLNQSRSR